MPEPTTGAPTTQPAPATPPPVPDCLVQKENAWYMKGIVDGKEVLTPVNEVQTRLQKDVASEQRFAAASAKEAAVAARETEIARQSRFWELTQRSEQGDIAATEEALRMLGKDPTEYLGKKGGQVAQAAPAALPQELQEAAAMIAAARNEGIDPMTALRYAHNAAAGEIRNEVFNTVEQTASLDSVLGPMLKDTKNKDLADVVRSDLQRHVKYLVGVEGAEPGPTTYARAVREISQRVGKLRGTQAGLPNQAPRNNPLGLGPAGSGVPGETVDTSKPVPNMSITTHGMDAWIKNFQERLARNAALQGGSTV